MCPPSRVVGCTERSRLTSSPGFSTPIVDRFKVSAITSTVKVSALRSTTVRHTPETAIESPCPASWVTFGPLTVSRAEPASASVTVRSTTTPRSSTMPVNMTIPLAARRRPAPALGPSSPIRGGGRFPARMGRVTIPGSSGPRASCAGRAGWCRAGRSDPLPALRPRGAPPCAGSRSWCAARATTGRRGARTRRRARK